MSAALFDKHGRSVYGSQTGYTPTTNHAAEYINVPPAPDPPIVIGATDDDDVLFKVFRFGNDGDLVADCFVEIAVPQETEAEDALDLVESVSVKIGGEVVDRHPVSWLRAGLFVPSAKREAYEEMRKFEKTASETKVAIFPLAFWFCRSPGQALPLVAISRQHVEIEIELADVPGSRFADVQLVGNMIYADDAERSALIDAPRSVLIDTVQTSEFDIPPDVLRFDCRPNLRGPVKCVYMSTCADISGAAMFVNGVQRFGTRSSAFWRNASTFWSSGDGKLPAGMYAIPMCADAWVHQPSGAMNCSALESLDLRIDLRTMPVAQETLTVFATSYNFLRIANGFVTILGPHHVG